MNTQTETEPTIAMGEPPTGVRAKRARGRVAPFVNKALQRGVTLVEILIVLAIVGLIAGGIAVYAVPKFQQAQKDSAKNSLKALHAVAEAWRANHGTDCPTPQLLKEQKELSASSDTNDPWGDPYKIQCDDDNTTVISFGPDKKEGTQDDIKFPADTTAK
ncbi:MAG TPA: type II secretion system protein [Polyangiaceae bacterium]|jgi:general secretion pathway protein G